MVPRVLCVTRNQIQTRRKSGAMKNYLIGIDSGTQSTRVIIFDTEGNVASGAAVRHAPLIFGDDGGIYMDEKDVWNSLCKAAQEAMAGFNGDRTRICGVGLSPHNGTICFMKNNGDHVLHPISYQDYRVAPIEPMADDCPDWEAWQRTYSRANLLKCTAPEQYEAIDKYASIGGFLGYMLTGKFVDTVSNVIGCMPLDRENFCWDKRDWVYDCVGMRRDQLCDIFLPGSVMGTITKEASGATGLPEGIPLVAGASDKQCEAFGAGAIQDKSAFISYGTEASLTFVSNDFHSMTKDNFFYSLLSVVPYQWNYTMPMARGYWLVSWFRDNFALELAGEAEKRGLGSYGIEDILTEQASKIEPGSEGLVIIPDWLANRSRPHGKGMMLGFTAKHTRAHVFRALIEGIAMQLRMNGDTMMDKIKGLKKYDRIFVGGGGSRSDLSMQITADVFGVEVMRAPYHETGSLGAAMCAGIGTGLFGSCEDAVARMGGSKRQVFKPDEARCLYYDKLYNDVFKHCYETMFPLFVKLDEIQEGRE